MTYSDADKAFRALPADIQAIALSRVGKPARPMSTMDVLLAIGETIVAEREKAKRLELAVEFAARSAWREDPPNANRKLTDTERLSAIKYHPTIKAKWQEGGQE